jgi:hypothetical protein
MPMMLRVAAQTAMIELDGIAAAPTTALDFLWHIGSQHFGSLLGSPTMTDGHWQGRDQSGWRDSNPRPPAPKAGALTKLRHIPCV